jgi:DNA invertase Pin-like site-specific DNA recombinase
MNRREYQLRARELAPRGDRLPHTKLTADQVREIRRLAQVREQERARINAEFSNAAIAARYGVHRRTVENVLSYQAHVNVYPD